jgi:hypothetical protein
MCFLPYPGAYLPTTPISQSQIALMPLPDKAMFLTGLDCKPTTDADPDAHMTKVGGYTLPVPADDSLGSARFPSMPEPSPIAPTIAFMSAMNMLPPFICSAPTVSSRA